MVPNAPPAATIDVDLSGAIWVGESQWERITATLTPLLGEVAPAELREDGEENDITFLAAETGLAPLEIGTWSASFRMARRTGQENAELSPEAVYIFIAQGEPTVYRDNALADLAHPERIELIEDGVLDGLAAIEPQRHRELLTAAVEQNIVPARLTTEFEKILASLATLRVARIGRQNIGGGKGTVTDILGAAELTDADSQVVLETLATHSGPLRDLWTNLQTEKNMSTEAVRRVKLTFELGSLTRNHVPLVTALSQQITRGDIGAKRDLAKFSPEQWAEFLTEKQPDGSAIGVPVNMDGDTEGEKVAMYSAILADQFERAYPTTAFAAKVGRTEAAMPAAAMAAKFVEANPAFFLDRMRVDHYLAQNKTALQGIDDPDATVAAVKTVQRVFKLNPTATAVDALLTREITSAQQVYFMGQSQFTAAIAESGVTSLDARRMYRKAEATYATVLNLFADLNVPLNGPSPAAVAPFTIDEETQAKIASLPNLQTLFGSLDYCECSQCRSVYGEAAYFVDILRFLGDRPTCQGWMRPAAHSNFV